MAGIGGVELERLLEETMELYFIMYCLNLIIYSALIISLGTMQ